MLIKTFCGLNPSLSSRYRTEKSLRAITYENITGWGHVFAIIPMLTRQPCSRYFLNIVYLEAQAITETKMPRRGSFCTLIVLWFCIVGGYVTQGRNLYISRTGKDKWPCDQKNPCKTIRRAVTLASRDDHIYVDGTNTDKDPYTCQSGTSVQPGIYITKSLSLIGYGNPLPRIQCSEGTRLTFNGSINNALEMSVTLSGFSFTGSPVTFQDSSACIKNCKFDDSQEGVKFITHKVIVSSLHITDSSFSGNKECISVESPYTNQNVSCSITLEDVTLSRNTFSSRGLVFLEMDNGNQNIHFQNVKFIDNSASSGLDGSDDSECIVGSRRGTVSIVINSSTFRSQSARLFDISASNILMEIHNSSFVGHKVKGNGGVISLRGIDHPEQRIMVNVSNSSFVNMTAAQGGAFNIDCINACSVNFRGCIFTGNTATAGNGGAVYIGSSRSVFSGDKSATSRMFGEAFKNITSLDTCHVTIKRSTFSTNNAHFSGGAISTSTNSRIFLILQNVTMKSNRATNLAGGAIFVNNLDSLFGTSGTRHVESSDADNITIELSTFSNNYAFRTGGAISISGNRQMVFIIATVTMESNTAKYSGGAIYSDIILSLVVHQSVFYNNSAAAYVTSFGGAITIKQVHLQGACNITIERSRFSNNNANYGGGAIFFKAFKRGVLKLQTMTLVSNTVQDRGGAVAVNNISAVKVENSLFLDNKALKTVGGTMSVYDTNILEVQGCHFRGSYAGGNGYGGALYVKCQQTSPPSILLFNTTFYNCCTEQVGGAFYLWAEEIARLQVKGSQFVENHALKLYGGAMAIFVNQGNMNSRLENLLLFENTTFERNAAIFGGAVHLGNGNAKFRNCCFINNLASSLGGHIHTQIGSTSLVIQDSVFNQTVYELEQGNKKSPTGTFFIDTESTGEMELSNTSLTANFPGNNGPLIQVRNGREVYIDKSTKLICPVGSQMQIIYFKDQVTTQTTVTTIEVTCPACEGNTYTLHRGHAFGLSKGPGFSCLPCPFGANCTQNIIAEPNFWGFQEQVNRSVLKFTMCPLGYCSSPQERQFPEYNSCRGNRSGILCGRCKESYTETLYSANCRPSHECNDNWVWPVALVYMSIMAFYFTFKPPIVLWIKRQILWFKEHESPNQDNNFDSGYVKIIFYFYQASNLLLVSNTAQHILKTELVEPVVGLFNFQQNVSPRGLICPFPGLTVVTKQLLLASHVFGTFFMIGIFYILHWGVKKIGGQDAPPAGRYIGGVLQTVLLGFTNLASMSFSLLRCVPIGSEKRFVLFYDGNIACFKPWQFIFMAFDFGFVVPFVFVLLWGCNKLYSGNISVGKFLLACYLPLPTLLYWVWVALSCRTARHSLSAEESPESQVSKISVERVLYDSFKRPEEGSKLSLSWEGIMIGRRLILIVLRNFITDPMPRLFMMSFFCVLFLLHHCMTQPFRNGIANKVETISLLCIVLLGLLNTFLASFHSLGVQLKGTNSLMSWSNTCQIVEIVILCFVPAVFCLFVVAAVFSQLCRLIVVLYHTICHLPWLCSSWRCGETEQNDEVSPLLV